MKSNILNLMAFVLLCLGTASCHHQRKHPEATSHFAKVLKVKNTLDNEINWNLKVQDTFFGAAFGDTMPDVIEKFRTHDIIRSKRYSGEKSLHFFAKRDKYFSFGGMAWENLNVEARNGKLSSIAFYNSYQDKTMALSSYQSLKESFEAKYKLVEQEPEDSTIYARCMAYGMNETIAAIVCYRYESIGHDYWIATMLVYRTQKDLPEVNEEL